MSFETTFAKYPYFKELTKFFNGDSTLLEEKTALCKYEWDNTTNYLYSKCLNNYTSYKTANPLAKTIFTIKEFVLGIFGKSDWNRCVNRLGGYFAVVHFLHEDGGRGMSNVSNPMSLKAYHLLADNLLRYQLGLESTLLNTYYNMDLAWAILPNLKGEHNNELYLAPITKDLAPTDFTFFESIFGFPQTSYIPKKNLGTVTFNQFPPNTLFIC